MLAVKRRRFGIIPRTWFVLLLAGCASFVSPPKAPWRIDDPPHSSPGLQSGTAGSTSPGGGAGPITAAKPEQPRIEIDQPPLQLPRTDEPAKTPKQTPDPFSSGPKILPDGVTLPGRLELNVDVPPRKQVGSGATFRLSIHNTGDVSVENVVVESEFDDELIFPGREVKKVRQEVGRIVGNETKQVSLTLVSDQTGNHCSRFTVTADGKEAVWKSVCVDFLPKTLDVQLVGPVERTVGSRAEYTIKLMNRSPSPLDGLHVALTHDSVLKAREASSGAEQKEGGLDWKLGTLNGGEGVQLQVEFDCGTTSEHACLFVTVTGDAIPDELTSACLSVRPVRGILDVQLDDRDDPVKAGDNVEYTVTVRNRGLQAARDVKLHVDVPPSLRVVSSTVQLQEQVLSVVSKVEEQQLLFDPVPGIAPDAVLRYVIVLKALRPEDAMLRVRATYAGSQTSTDVTEITTINP